LDNALTDDERRQLLKTIRQQRIVADQGRLFTRPMPKELLKPYALQGKDSAPMHNIQRKYATLLAMRFWAMILPTGWTIMMSAPRPRIAS